MDRSSWTKAGLNGSGSSCPGQSVEIWKRKSGISITLPQQNCSRRQPTLWDSAARPGSKHVTMEPTSIEHRFSALCKESRYNVGDATPSFARSDKSGNTRATCRGVVDQAFADPAVQKRMTGKWMFDVSVDLTSCQKPQIIWVCVDVCSTQGLDIGGT